MIEDKDIVRTQIIDEASKIFGHFGYKKTSMEQIAVALNKGKSSIYYYFTSKEAIFEAVIEKEVSLMRKKNQEAMGKTTNAAEKFKAYIVTRMKGFEEMANMYQVLKNEYLTHITFINQIRKRYDHQEIENIRLILEEGVASGEFNISNAELAAFAIATAIKGLEIPLFFSGEKVNVEQQIENLIHILFNGILIHK
jgi:AcrR family transcriptional regulator